MKPVFELEGLSFIDDLAEEYRCLYGSAPFNVSHWDPSDEIVKTLIRHLKLPTPPIPIPYIFSYAEGKPRILSQLGYRSLGLSCGLVPAGTSAMVLACGWLKSLNITRLLILCPAYFPIFYIPKLMNIRLSKIYMKRENEEWKLPKDEIYTHFSKMPENTAIWITNPIYCTGRYLFKSDIAFIGSLLEKGATVITDECLSIKGYEIGNEFSEYDRFLGIYSPHKSVCINAVKFSAMVFSSRYQQFFDRWSDVLIGGLSASAFCAILHYLSDNFLDYQSAFIAQTNQVYKSVREMILEYNGLINMDKNVIGQFMTCYSSNISGQEGNNNSFLRRLVLETGVLLVPGVHNHFSPEICFNFRINLARGCPQFFSALGRVFKYLARADF